jgi:hypothetical protein
VTLDPDFRQDDGVEGAGMTAARFICMSGAEYPDAEKNLRDRTYHS